MQPYEDVQIEPGSPQPDLSTPTGPLRIIVQPYFVRRGNDSVGVIRLWLEGELTARTVGALSRTIMELRKRGARRFALDAGRLADLDAAGVCCLLDSVDALRLWEGDLRIINVLGKVRLLLDLMDVRRILSPEGEAEEHLRQLALAPQQPIEV